MRLDVALSRLKAAARSTVRTADAMGILSVNKDHASHILSRLADSGHVVRLKRGLWATAGDDTDPGSVSGEITAPFPSYLSLQTALYHHGMIAQIPERIYCVSIARTGIVSTPIGTFSIHHVAEEFFFGYERAGHASVAIATPEKALMDFLYLAPAKSRLFTALPEMEWPSGFSFAECRKIMSRVKSARRRAMMRRRFDALLASRTAG